jgi:hypothetical protein
MRAQLGWLLIFVACGTFRIAASQNQASATTQPVVTLNVSAVQPSVKVGSPVRVKVVLQNISDHDIIVSREVRGLDCRVDVRDAEGRLAPDTKLGYLWNGHVSNPDLSRLSSQELTGSLISGSVKRGETLTWELDASKFYEIKQPGKYSIQVERKDPENHSLMVKSNVITVTVTP